MKTEYQVTIGYKAVICVQVFADSEQKAKEQALGVMKKQTDKMYKKQGFELQDECYKADGILNMDETWNMVQG